eukprot:COSAG05_NODE_8195_length_727_cov_1.937898_1_plen_162_part_01
MDAAQRLRRLRHHLLAAATAATAPPSPQPDRKPLGDAADEYRRNGCVVLRNILGGAELRRLQEAFRAGQAGARAEWEAEKDTPGSFLDQKYFDIPVAIQTDPEAWLALLAQPALEEMAKAAIGDDAKVIAIQARTVPRVQPGEEHYADWHRDSSGEMSHPLY